MNIRFPGIYFGIGNLRVKSEKRLIKIFKKNIFFLIFLGTALLFFESCQPELKARISRGLSPIPDKAAPEKFSYLSSGFDQNAVQVLREIGYLFARRGVSPEFPHNDEGSSGPTDEPDGHDPLLIPCINRLCITASQLRCEYLKNPLGLDTERPRFSWTLTSSQRGQMQTAYQILVASQWEMLAKDKGDKWDSGKVKSGQSVNLAYQGKELASGEECWWKVRVWDKDGKTSAYSEPATFEMGLLKPGDWHGQWIQAARPISAPLFRRAFTVSGEIKRARIYISGLGWSELYVNGIKVSDHVLDPATTYYNNDQPIELGSRILYVTHDVTEYLHNGQNALGVILGNGWYSNDEGVLGQRRIGRKSYGDRPILLLQMNIEYTDGQVERIVTDDHWKTSAGPITANEMCLGEDYDARLEKAGWNIPGTDDSTWSQAAVADAPSGEMVSQIMPAIKVMKTIKPVKLTQPDERVYIYDFGQHFSGWTKLRVQGPKGAKVRIRHAGMLTADGHLDIKNQRDALQTDTYILKGDGLEEWEPKFTLHGFRYAEITGFPGTPTFSSLEGRFAHNAVETSGRFESSNALINQIHQNVCWTFKSSLQGIPQDAADRAERVAWLGDAGFVLKDYLYNFDTVLFWTKWLEDIKDSQKPDGDIPVVSPLHWRPIYPMWPCWKSAYPLTAWYLYLHYGDERILATHYEGMAKLVDFLGRQADNDIIAEGLGDHMEPDRALGQSYYEPKRTPSSLTSTGFYYFDAWILAQAARILGKTEDYKSYTKLADRIKTAFNDKFLNKETNQYAAGSQTANAMSLIFDLVPVDRRDDVLLNLVDDIMVKNEGYFSTGIIGTDALAQVLGKLGRADVMYEVATKTMFPSWGYSISRGATTLWEKFDADLETLVPGDEYSSLNMKMFGSIEKFFYKDLAGIDLGSPGFKQIIIKPCVVGDLKYVKASLKTVQGLIAIHWKRGDRLFELKVIIPPNSTAKVSLPNLRMRNVKITESGHPVWENGSQVGPVAGIANGVATDDYITFDIGSGFYVFRLAGE